jgi:hypothetical protein
MITMQIGFTVQMAVGYFKILKREEESFRNLKIGDFNVRLAKIPLVIYDTLYAPLFIPHWIITSGIKITPYNDANESVFIDSKPEQE